VSRRPSLLSLLPLLLGGALLPPAATAQVTPRTYIAFGDSITFGTGDQANLGGYPGRLQTLLIARGVNAQVVNAGLPGETTVDGLTRINTVLNRGGDVLLLMEGTNDINEHVSLETTIFDLNQMATRAEARGMQAVHATIPPRLSSANYDGTNHFTESLAVQIRELAFRHDRRLADPFEVFFHLTPNFESLYVGGSDKLHPNAAGYDLMARVFADVLTNVDSVPPVVGGIFPLDGATDVPASTSIDVDLYDFGAGIDLSATQLLINGQAVVTPLNGTPRKVTISYQSPQPLAGGVTVSLHSRDTATPPNTLDRQLTQFVIAGTTFLAGDLDRNGRVDGADLLLFAPHFGARTGDPRYRAVCDLNNDGIVDGQDLALLATNFGRSSF